MSSTTSSIPWSDVIKKEARGLDGYDLGEVQDVGQNYVLTQKGIASKKKFFIPKYLVNGYDGDKLWFNVSETQAENEFMRDSPPMTTEYTRYRTTETPVDIETRIPVIEERLNVAKRVSTQEATITKEPLTETKTMDVPVTHEELNVERKPASSSTSATEGPVQSKTEMKVPLSSEQVEVTKEPYVKEEVVVKKTPVTETQTVSDTVTSEKVNVQGGTVPSNMDTDED